MKKTIKLTIKVFSFALIVLAFGQKAKAQGNASKNQPESLQVQSVSTSQDKEAIALRKALAEKKSDAKANNQNDADNCRIAVDKWLENSENKAMLSEDAYKLYKAQEYVKVYDMIFEKNGKPRTVIANNSNTK